MGIDLGAGSLKISIIGDSGQLYGSASSEVETSILHPGWSEQDPEQWYQGLCSAVPRALDEAGISAQQITAISFSAGAHTPVLLDKDDQVIRPAILWSDQRSSIEARELFDCAGDMIVNVSLNTPNPTWTLPQLKWLQRHEPETISRVHRLFVAKDYLRYRVTGLWHTDRIDAAGTMLADTKGKAWSVDICDLIGWDMSTLPPIVDPVTIVGDVSNIGATETGLAEGTPVVAGTMDTAIEGYGAGAVDPGQGVIKLATAGAVSVINERLEPHASVIDYPHVIPDQAFSITGTNSCASAHRWLKDQLFSAPAQGEQSKVTWPSFGEMDRLASDVTAGAEGLIFHPYLQGERSPYWDPLLRADFIGITMQHNRAHFVRALYEGVAYSLYDCILSLEEQGLILDDVRLIGGGAQSETWRQIVCDVIGKPISVPKNGDASFGAALVAGVGVGCFSNERDAVERCVSLEAYCTPDDTRHKLYQELFLIYKDSQASLASINHRISEVISPHG
jgi:xylulokinase